MKDDIMRFVYYSLCMLLLVACSSQVREKTEIPDGKVNIIAECNEYCRSSLRNKYNIRASATHEVFKYIERGDAHIDALRIISINNSKVDYGGVFGVRTDILLDPGYYSIEAEPFGYIDNNHRINIYVKMKSGQYGFSVFKVNFGWFECWFPMVFSYDKGDFLYPHSAHIEWHKGYVPLTNADAIRFDIKGIKNNPMQCEQMDDYLANSHLTKDVEEIGSNIVIE